MRFEVLGPLQAVAADRPLPLGGTQQQKLLALLLAADSNVISVDRLVDELWGAEPPPSANHLIQVYVSRLRGLFGNYEDGPAIKRDGAGYVMKVAPDDLDAACLERSLEEVGAHEHHDPGRTEAVLAPAVALWRGRPFGELADESPLLQAEAQRLEDLYLRASESLYQARLDLGLHGEVVADLKALTGRFPFHEGFWRRLMLALYRSGRQVEALRVYQDMRRMLGEELGIEPTSDTRELEERILLHDPRLLWESPPPRNNLPTLLTSFVGRSAELAEITKRLETSRLVTLTGPGGIGKTRLALEAAELVLLRYPDGVWWVNLASISSPELVATELAKSLGVVPQPSSPLEAIARSLAPRRALIVIDNCEQVAEAVARVVVHLLLAAPEIHFVATSRKPLHAVGETLLTVPAMAMPMSTAGNLVDLQLADAVRLFADRAAALDARFVLDEHNAAAVVEICRRLDGIPLAIEMAAARVRAMSPAAIAESLTDRFALLVSGELGVDERHASMKAALDWSYDMLSSQTEHVFERISVFVGSFDIRDVAALAGDAENKAAALAAISELVDHSMCSRIADAAGQMRFRLLETLREYGRQKLEERRELGTAREAHADHFLGIVGAAVDDIETPRLAPHLAWLRLAYDDVQGALEWSLATHNRDRGFSAAPVLLHYWLRSGDALEAKRWSTRMLESAEGVPNHLLAAVHLCSSFACTILGPPEDSMRHSLEAIRIYEEVGDDQSLVTALFGNANAHLQAGDVTQAESVCIQALEVCAATGNQWGRAGPLATLGLIHMFTGRLETARRFAEEALPIHRELGDRAGLVVLNALPSIAIKQGDYAAAERAAIDMATDAAGTAWQAAALVQLGEALMGKGDLAAAGAALRRGTVAASESGLENWFRMGLRNLAHWCVLSDQPETAARLAGASRRDMPGFGLDPAIYQAIGEGCLAVMGEDEYGRLADEGFRMSHAGLIELSDAVLGE